MAMTPAAPDALPGWEPRALVDGVRLPLADARLPVADVGVAWSDGVFETLGVWSGRPFALESHLDRLTASLAAVGLPDVDRDLVRTEALSLCEGAEVDAALRILLPASGTRVLVLEPLPVRPDPRVLVPQPAPWIRPSAEYGPAGAKTMSYLPYLAAARAARAAGGDDALLLSTEGWILEGSTFGVCWVRDGVLHAPDPALGIIDSISRRALLDLARGHGVAVALGRFGLGDLDGASEVLVSSALRDVIAVAQVGDLALPASAPLRDLLSTSLDAARRAGGARRTGGP